MRLAYSLYSLHEQASKKDMCEILDIKPEVLSTTIMKQYISIHSAV